MKHLSKITLAASLLTSTFMATTAHAEVSANLGLLSEYHFRGIIQNGTATATGGLDYENGSWSVGIWGADVEDGLEIDIYGAYGYEFESGLSLSAGLTKYLYTGDFDSSYDELNLGAGLGGFSLEYTIGKWDGIEGQEASTEADYTFLGLTFEHEGFHATLGSFGDDFDGEYGELGYGTQVAGFDVGIAVVISGSDLDNDESVYFSVSKSFSL